MRREVISGIKAEKTTEKYSENLSLPCLIIQETKKENLCSA